MRIQSLSRASLRSRFTTPGLPFPWSAFITCPTNHPKVAALPPRYVATCSGWSLTTLSTASRIGPSSLIWTSPFSFTRSSTDRPVAMRSASSSLAIFPEIEPSSMRATSAARAPRVAGGVGHPREELGEDPVRDRLRVLWMRRHGGLIEVRERPRQAHELGVGRRKAVCGLKPPRATGDEHAEIGWGKVAVAHPLFLAPHRLRGAGRGLKKARLLPKRRPRL